jgi:hypothetical protein
MKGWAGDGLMRRTEMRAQARICETQQLGVLDGVAGNKRAPETLDRYFESTHWRQEIS